MCNCFFLILHQRQLLLLYLHLWKTRFMQLVDVNVLMEQYNYYSNIAINHLFKILPTFWYLIYLHVYIILLKTFQIRIKAWPVSAICLYIILRVEPYLILRWRVEFVCSKKSIHYIIPASGWFIILVKKWHYTSFFVFSTTPQVHKLKTRCAQFALSVWEIRLSVRYRPHT